MTPAGRGIFFSCGEVSGDGYAAAVLDALRRRGFAGPSSAWEDPSPPVRERRSSPTPEPFTSWASRMSFPPSPAFSG